jgi:hypothetical protein
VCLLCLLAYRYPAIDPVMVRSLCSQSIKVWDGARNMGGKGLEDAHNGVRSDDDVEVREA